MCSWIVHSKSFEMSVEASNELKEPLQSLANVRSVISAQFSVGNNHGATDLRMAV